MIKKKGASLALTATLLASLLATVFAPIVSADVAQGGATGQTIGRGQTGATQTYSFTENAGAQACFDVTGGDELVITFEDPAPGLGEVTVTNVSIVQPTMASLGASAAVGPAANQIRINFAGVDDASRETVTVQYQLAVANSAETGPISATLSGSEFDCVVPAAAATVTATGTLTANVPAGTGSGAAAIQVQRTSACGFDETNGFAGGNALSGPLVFATSPEPATRNVDDASEPGGVPPQAETLSLDTDVTFTHFIGEVVSQVVPNCAVAPTSATLASPASIGNVLIVRVGTVAPVRQVLPGQNNQPAGSIGVDENPSAVGTSLDGRTITFTIIPAGVTFSTAPATYGPAVPPTCTMAADRRSCSIIVGTTGAGLDEVGIVPTLDVEASVPTGTPVTVNVAVSGGAAPVPGVANTSANANPGVIAFVGRVIVGTAGTPNVIIGANNQVTGAITLRESGPGFFQAGIGMNNTFAVCLMTGEFFTFAPTATVSNGGGTGAGGGAPGNLTLFNPAAPATPASSVQGTLFTGAGSGVANNCASWTVFAPSTAGAATITITDGTTNNPNGAHVNVPAGSPPGTTQAAVLVGQAAAVTTGCGGPVSCNVNPSYAGAVAIAVRVFNGGITVTAASQPRIPAGSNNALAGDIVLTENLGTPALAGRFRAGQVITFTVLARATPIRQEVLINSTNTADSPRIVTNSAESGLLASPAVVTCPALVPFVGLCTISTVITQQSFGGPGTQPGILRLENIHYNVLADAQPGPVQVQVTGNGAGGATPFQAVVTNAIIGPEPAAPTRTSIINGTLAGVVKVSEGRTFTAATKIVPVGGYCTWQADMDPASSGERVEVWIAKKSLTGASYTAFTKFSTRAVNSQGLAAFHYDNADQPGWVSVKFAFAGNASHGPASSLARQCKYQG